MAEGRRPDVKQIAQQVIKLLEADLATGGYDLLDVRVFQGGGRFQIRIFVDLLATAESPAGGIGLAEVARASRTAGMLLEEADLFADQYVVEVSSPGIRRPLRTLDHYQAACGERIDLKVAGSARVRGLLQEVTADELVVLPAAAGESEEGAAEPVAVRVNLDRVLEGNLDPEFDVQAIINADRRQRKDTKRRSRQERAGRRKKSRPKNRSQDRPDTDGGST